MTSKQTLKQWFSNLKKPTQNHFWAWLDSYFHKEEKIPMSQIEGLDKALQDTASSTQINNHFSDNQAHKALFDLKVDKVQGKGLSTEDFTSALKEKLENLQNTDPDSFLEKGTFEGTASDLKTALDNILAILQSDDTELDQLQEIVNYIKQNKKILGQLGIPNIAGLVDALSGKAPLTHTHAWDDITGKPTFFSGSYNDLTNKPTDLATETFVSEEIGKLKIGGRNLLRFSETFNVSFWDAQESITIVPNQQDPTGGNKAIKFNCAAQDAYLGIRQSNVFKYPAGTPITFSFWIKANKDKAVSLVFGNYNPAEVLRLNVTTQWQKFTHTYIVKGNEEYTFHIGGWSMLSDPDLDIFVFHPKAEVGNLATDWTPAPEDIFAEISTRQLLLSQSVTTSSTINGFSQNGRTMISTGTNEIVVTIDSPDGFSATYQKGGLGNISFVVGSGKTLVQVDGTNVISGAKGSTATISVVGSEILLRISNV